ncbi:aminotransferase class V-fold PLP-dependent enzyme [Salinibacterium soli]|uniref:Aminotransferase class V-fold PLP-dependent enzyme n=1 Tax=Antiquaquibacter soli TaxID=3064523 RepID=A0ABT9BLP2_9MICO|nr:aminotransferase class V-fold PLP-dependent enzyme [Protaetiibacter sp. WY-16]MDO7881931.1 aminotransferase class V-fold PLP-dependent enzyme [Protaetiibacter sp. WY-16]
MIPAVARPAPLVSTEGTTGREEWALDPAQRHINHGSYGAVPRRTLAFQQALKNELEANPLQWFDTLPDRMAAERAALAAFLGAEPHEIAAVPNASAAASVMFGSLRLNAGDEVLITDHVYGAVALGARRFADRWGAVVRVAAVPLAAGAEESLDAIASAVTSRTRVAIVDHISSATARGFPIAEIVELAQQHGFTLLVDGAHAAGILESAAEVAAGTENVVWFGNLHKFPAAPRPAAVLVARGALADATHPLIDSWGAGLPYPDRFDQQGTIDTTGFLSASFGIGEIERLFGWAELRRYGAELGAYAVSILAPALGEWVDDPVVELGMPEPLQPLLRLPEGVAADAAGQRALKNALSREAGVEAGVMTWNGGGYLRLSAHAYNEAEDYERLLERGIPVIARIAAEHSRAH